LIGIYDIFFIALYINMPLFQQIGMLISNFEILCFSYYTPVIMEYNL